MQERLFFFFLQMYTVNITREQIPLAVTFCDVREQIEFECPVSLSALYKPVSIHQRWEQCFCGQTPSFIIVFICHVCMQWTKDSIFSPIYWHADTEVKSWSIYWASLGRGVESSGVRAWAENVKRSRQMFLLTSWYEYQYKNKTFKTLFYCILNNVQTSSL